MKKVFYVVLILLICGCQDKEIATKVDEIITPPVEVYTDDNPIKISLYCNSDSGLDLTSTYSSKWIDKEVIGQFTSALTDDKIITDYYYQDTWDKYYKNYSNIDNYRIGYYISFKLKDGTTQEKLVLNPKEIYAFYPYLSLYLYDDVHQVKGAWYRHVEEEEMKSDTLLTTIKLVALENVDMIDSDILLTAFTYDEDDFKDNKYRGNSSYTVTIKREF